MRLWHKDLIKYLPTKQLRGQWRECFLVAKELKEGNSELVQFTQNLYVKYKQAIKWSHPDRFAT